MRAGHALYGYVSPARGDAPPQLLDVKPALTWKAKLLAVKEIPEGALVGYGGSFRAPRAMRIGILGAGYADGMFHRLSNRGKVIADGKLTPILGTVSMDLTTIDLSHTTALAAGDEVTLLGTEGECSARRAADRQSGRDHLLQHPLQHQRARTAGVCLVPRKSTVAPPKWSPNCR